MPRFQPGQSGNPSGRPAYTAEFARQLVKLVKRHDWRDIVLKAIEQAKRGDPKAREWLSDRVMGKAGQLIDITSAGEKISFDLTLLNDEQLTALEEIIKAASNAGSNSD
jgi:pyridoxal/pyridoxine/pyridoxamine kinase